MDLEKHVGIRLDDLQARLKEYVDVRIDAINTATNLARDSMEKRLEGMNEFRDSLRDQASRFLAKSSYDDAQDRELEEHRRLNESIRQLELSRSELAGKASRGAVLFSQALAVLSILLAIIALILK